MRKIKFRAKKINGNWVYGNIAVVKETRDVWQIIDDKGLGFFVDKKTIGQFTGVYDTNEKEIYEGDIFKMDDYTNGVVVYLEDMGSYGFSFKDDEGELHLEPFSYYNFNVMEVLGNKVDNPELLGGSNE